MALTWVKIGNLRGPAGPVGELLRGVMPANSDANTFTTSGLWYTGGVGIAETQKNLAVPQPSSFFVLAANAPFVITQFQMPSVPTDTNVYYRSRLTGSVWSPWVSLARQYDKGILPPGTDVNELFTPGNYYTGGAGVGETHLNLAEAVPSALHVMGSGTRFGASQIQIPVAGDPRFYFRTKRTGSVWSSWINLADKGGGGGGGGASSGPAVNWAAPSVSHEMRVQAFKDDYPQVSTGGKGCVVFRYDHGLTNIKSTLLPLHQTAGIPFYVAMNSRNWDIAENSGMTQAEAKALPASLVEWGNHTSDHLDRNTAEGIYDTIVNGRKELEAQLGRTIHGFTVPGLTDFNKFEGFASGSLNSYSETLAGGLILANHAICSGVIGSIQRPLDGVIRQGSRHYGWETASFAEVKAQVDEAVTNKTALTLMAHPRVLGTSGYFTAALAKQVIDYVKSKIDAGQLANISYYQSHHAKLYNSATAIAFDTDGVPYI